MTKQAELEKIILETIPDLKQFRGAYHIAKAILDSKVLGEPNSCEVKLPEEE